MVSRSWRRRDPSIREATIQPLGAILIATVLGGLVLLATGHDPIFAYGELVRRVLLRGSGLTETAVRSAPLLIAGIAALVAVKGGLWNIGIDGQVLIGAMAAGWIGGSMGSAPAPLVWLLCAAGGIVGGGLWALAPALLRAFWGLNEIVTSIMFNYLALSLTAWLVKGPIRDRSLVSPQTAMIPRELRLPALGDTRLHIGIVVALALAILAHLVMRYTVAGYELSVVGASVRAARHGLIPVSAYQTGAFVASGALAGLAGVNDILSTKGTFQAEWNPGYGLAAFAAVFLARKSWFGLIPAALFLGVLSYGGDIMPRAADIAPAFFDAFEGLLLIVLALSSWLLARASAGDAA